MDSIKQKVNVKDIGKITLAQHTNSFGVTTTEMADMGEEDDLSLPTTSLFHGALQENCPTATLLGTKGPTLRFLEDGDCEMPATYAAAAVNTVSHTSSVQELSSPRPRLRPRV